MFVLPNIQKKVIYLDQFVYINFAKICLEKKWNYKSFYEKMRKKILELYCLQAIVCPCSDSHDDESSLSTINKKIKKEYEKFSCSVEFKSYSDIQLKQLLDLSFYWLGSCRDYNQQFDVNEVVEGDINAWNDLVCISINREWPTEWIEEDRNRKSSLQHMVNLLYAKYRGCTFDPFESCYNDEKKAYGQMTIGIYMEYLKGNPLFYNKVTPLPPDQVHIVNVLFNRFIANGISCDKSLEKVFDFLRSREVSNLPFIKIPALIYASIARKIKNGMKKPIDAGTQEDVKMISHLIPYCDTMFIDKIMHNTLMEHPIKEQIGFPTKIFSISNKDEFIGYLDSIEKNIPEDQVEHARMLYWYKQTEQ